MIVETKLFFKVLVSILIASLFTGGYASSWWFVLTQVAGYNNVKLYDGSAQEWIRYYDMVPYRWD
ncbi:MAG: hypothetical protein JSV31_30770 [Desulfobacterales bacterium]|nr:MAG: hypothetical protein JSV31_30770 [Desulfobacterales bacterium]